MTEIMVDGRRYVLANECGEIQIIVLERGFVYVGRLANDGSRGIVITDARCIIRWGTENHLAQLVNGPLPNTKLGDRCTVRANSMVHTLEVNQDAWAKHTGG